MRLRNTKKILLLINYFNFEPQLFELAALVESKTTLKSGFSSLYARKSPFCKAFPSIRALTVWWAHSYSVRKWRKVAQSGFFERKTLKFGETHLCFAELTLSVSMQKAVSLCRAGIVTSSFREVQGS